MPGQFINKIASQQMTHAPTCHIVLITQQAKKLHGLQI